MREPLLDNIAAAEAELREGERAQPDKVSALPAEYPGWMLERQSADRLASLGERSSG